MAGESLSFPITAEDRASDKFKAVGNAALAAAGKVDIAAASLKLWNDTSVKSAKADDTLIASRLAMAKADAALARAESFVASEAAKSDTIRRRRIAELNHPVVSSLFGGAARLLGLAGGGAGGVGGVAAAAASSGAPAAAAGGGGGLGALGSVGLVAGLAALASGLGGLIPALAAATGGIAAFAALALPTLTQLFAKSAQLTAVKTVFASLVAALRPDVVKIFDTGMKILIGLLPQLLPFANAAAKAFEVLLKGFGQFAASKGFGVFLNQLNKLTGPTITVFGEGIGKVVIALGKLLIALANPNALRIAKYLFDGIAGFITIVAKVIDWVTGRIEGNLHKWAVMFDDVRHAMASFGDFVAIWTLRISILFAGWAKNFVHYAQDAFGWLPNFIPGVAGIKTGLANAQRDLTSFVSGAQGALARLTSKTYGIHLGIDLPPGVSAHSVTGIKGQLASGTSGAAAGWFLVGERGPELVRMRGGEVVIPNHALGGYAAGTGEVTVHLSVPSLSALGGLFSRAIAAVVGSVHLTGQLAARAFGGGGGTSGGSVAALAHRMAIARGWGNFWGAIQFVENAEAGWNLHAQNPTSRAYGIAQFINGPSEYYQYGGNPNTAVGQITGFYNYIRARYGNPAAAAQHEAVFHNYAGGTWSARPGLAMVGEHGPELVSLPRAGAQTVVIQVASTGHEFDAFLLRWFQKNARIRGGNVQVAFGRT